MNAVWYAPARETKLGQMALESGTKFGPYVIVSALGAGGMATSPVMLILNWPGLPH